MRLLDLLIEIRPAFLAGLLDSEMSRNAFFAGLLAHKLAEAVQEQPALPELVLKLYFIFCCRTSPTTLRGQPHHQALFALQCHGLGVFTREYCQSCTLASCAQVHTSMLPDEIMERTSENFKIVQLARYPSKPGDPADSNRPVT